MKFQSRRYVPCHDFETENPVGKLCFKYCVKKKFLSKKCKEWETDIKDMSNSDDFKEFRSANFVMMLEV